MRAMDIIGNRSIDIVLYVVIRAKKASDKYKIEKFSEHGNPQFKNEVRNHFMFKLIAHVLRKALRPNGSHV